jgi:hypothetical protein
MRKLDFFVQTVIVIAGLVAVTYAFEAPDGFLFILMVQFVLGCWQMLSSFLSLKTLALYRRRDLPR